MKLKDKKITVLQATTVKVNGVNVKRFKKILTDTWCFYQQIPGSASLTDVNGLQIYDSTEKAQFIVNKRTDVLPTIGDVILFRNRYYDILTIDDYQGYHTELKLIGQIADNQDAEDYPEVEE